MHIGGEVKKVCDFIAQNQLMESELWCLFVNKFGVAADAEDFGWRGEYWGKMMRGASLICKNYQVEGLYEVLEKTVWDLIGKAEPNGRISTYSIEKEFNGWDMWGRKYVSVGLQYFLEICKDNILKDKIIESLKGHCDYIIEKVGKESGKKPILETSNIYGSLNSSSILKSFVRMYEITHQERYLDFAKYIIDEGGANGFNLFETALKNTLKPYQYPVTKAYEMISCFEGLLEYYTVCGGEKYLQACKNFADAVLQTDVTVVGGLGWFDEKFDNSTRWQTVQSKMQMQETCVTVSMMLYLTELKRVTGNARYSDYIELMFYNLYRGSLNTELSKNNCGLPFDSYSPLICNKRAVWVGGKKQISADRVYGCCAAIGAAGAGIFLDGAFSYKNSEFIIDQYFSVNKEFVDGNAKLLLSIETDYPRESEARIVINSTHNVKVRLRVPSGCSQLKVAVDGIKYSTVGDYIELVLHKGESAIRLEFEMTYQWINGSSLMNGTWLAVKRGPIVFCADKRISDTAKKFYCETEKLRVDNLNLPDYYAACVVTESNGVKTVLVDYGSAGKSWDESSEISVWFEQRLVKN